MKGHLTKSYVLLGIVVVGCAIIILAGITGLRKPSSDNTQQVSPAAGSQGSSTTGLSESQLQDLMDRSSAIVVGTVVSNICRLTADKESVNTNYTVKVSEVLRGSLQADKTVLVSLPGGLVMFKADGSEVTEKNQLKTLKKPIRVEGSEKIVPQGAASSKFVLPVGTMLVNEKAYVLFLTENPDDKRGFVLTELNGSSQSSFEMEKNNEQAQLLNDIRTAIARGAAQ